MSNLIRSEPSPPVYQHAEISLRFGKHAGFRVTSDLTSGGFMAIGVMVSGILLSTAVLVGVAVHESRRSRR